MSETGVRRSMVRWGKSLFERGLTSGASGNISVKIDDGFVVTPTNSCLGFLDADRLTRLDESGKAIDGDPPTKELPLHLTFYTARPSTGAVVHLHSTYATAVSCLADADPDDAVPSLTPYVLMRLGRVPMIPYTRPGSPEIAPLIAAQAPNHPGILLANHGPVVAGATLDAAVFAIEELEEAAKLLFITRGLKVRHLDGAAVAELEAAFRMR
jgi:ribulose-5-phosphate 4-epimerase/fuculose-1-phosphate aldolase